jgi:hypothetical protein
VLLNRYEELTEQPVAARTGIDFLCFTDDPALTSQTWHVRSVSPLFPADPARSQRYLKIRADRLLPDYDVSLYVDNSVLLRVPPERLIEAFLPAGQNLAMMRHSFRKTVRDEFAEVVALRFDSARTCEEQEAHYASTPLGSLDERPLWSGIIVRRHHDPTLVAAMELWYAHVLRYSRRDQLSVWYALRAAGIDPLVHDFDNHDSPFHRWPVSVGRDRRRAGIPWALSLERHMCTMQDDVHELTSQLSQVTSSKAWRWTAPLRRARTRLGRLQSRYSV